MQRTLLKEHKKHGDTLETPLLQGDLGKIIQLSSWSKDSLPEYYWIALIFNYFGRERGMVAFSNIMKDLKKYHLLDAELSKILNYPPGDQKLFCEIVDRHVPHSVLVPLTIVLSKYENTYFYKYYVDPSKPIEEKLELLFKIAKDNMTFHEHSSSDICFIVVWFSIYAERLHFMNSLPGLDAFSEYPRTLHSDEKMRLFRPTIRSTFQGLSSMNDHSFSANFWNELAQITSCDPLIICFAEENYRMDFYNEIKDALEFIKASNNDKKLEKKYEVVMGITTYIIKLFSEIVDNDLANAISGRVILRTMIEGYLNLKFILMKEREQPKIFEMFEDYGTGKIKLVNSKLREGKYSVDDNSHIKPFIVEHYVNENKDEEFINISLGYFDRTSIKNKASIVGEDLLYEIYYEYDTNYSHVFWGAIRESAMLICENPSHLYHATPDYHLEQKLPTVMYDCELVLKKLMECISDYVGLPDSYVKKYLES